MCLSGLLTAAAEVSARCSRGERPPGRASSGGKGHLAGWVLFGTGREKTAREMCRPRAIFKRLSGKTYYQIANEMGLTNTYVAQLFLNQAQLKPNRVDALRKAVPELGESDLEIMQQCPYRSFDEEIRDEPLVYRLLEAVLHHGEGLKSIVNEKFGDGIKSAIDFYFTVDKIKGSQGEDRVVITFNGKFLPFIEQTKEGSAFGVGEEEG